MKFHDYPSPNFNERRDGQKPELIVVHYTGMKSTEDALQRLADPKSEVSCHYLIDEQGNVFQMVDEEKRAWHAGVSQWQGKGDVNSRSIGIEISNRGHEKFTNKQQAVLVLLCRDIMHRHGIPPENVIGHSDVAPGRKQDPGPLFPWKKMAHYGIGRWPRPSCKDKFNAAAACKNEKQLKHLFRQAGYGVDAHGKDSPTLEQVVAAFQSRYEPLKFKKPKHIGVPNSDTMAKLRALVRQIKKNKP